MIVLEQRVNDLESWQDGKAPTPWMNDSQRQQTLQKIVSDNQGHQGVYRCISNLMFVDADYHNKADEAAAVLHNFYSVDMRCIVVANEAAGETVKNASALQAMNIDRLQMDLRWRKPPLREKWPDLGNEGRYVVDILKPLFTNNPELQCLPCGCLAGRWSLRAVALLRNTADKMMQAPSS